jgi:hypothetical protein
MEMVMGPPREVEKRTSKLYLSELQEERKAGKELFYEHNGKKYSQVGIDAILLGTIRIKMLGVLLPFHDAKATRNWVKNWFKENKHKRKGTVR